MLEAGVTGLKPSNVTRDTAAQEPPIWKERLRQAALVAGPLVALFAYRLLPREFSDTDAAAVEFAHAGRATLAVMIWMAIWWLSEAIDIYATALLPIAVFPLLGVSTITQAAAPYANPLIFLFLGGFLIAKAIEKSGLHRRLATALLRQAGNSSYRILGGVMLCTAFLSLWISNTASAMVVAPIAAAIAGSQNDKPRFGTTLMLGVAFSATIGGMGSLIGTPPNAIFAAHVRSAYGVNVGFAQWAAIGIPVALVLLLFAWLVLTQVSPRLPNTALKLSYEQPKTENLEAERRVAVIAGLTALAWFQGH